MTVRYRVTQLISPCQFYVAEDNEAMAYGRRRHEWFEGLFPSPPWVREEEVCIPLTRTVEVCGHPDLYIVEDGTGLVIEYKSSRRLRGEYVDQVSAYAKMLSLIHGVKFSRALWLKDVVLTDNPILFTMLVPRNVMRVIGTVQQMDFEDPDVVWFRLVNNAVNPVKRAGPHCFGCVERSRCNEALDALTLLTDLRRLF